jgi:hypothetical protein
LSSIACRPRHIVVVVIHGGGLLRSMTRRPPWLLATLAAEGRLPGKDPSSRGALRRLSLQSFCCGCRSLSSLLELRLELEDLPSSGCAGEAAKRLPGVLASSVHPFDFPLVSSKLCVVLIGEDAVELKKLVICRRSSILIG